MPIQVHTIGPVGRLSNYIHLLHHTDSGETAVVDPTFAQPVLDLLDQRGWRLGLILNTHHHVDHTGGNLDLKSATGAVIAGAACDSHRLPGLDRPLHHGDCLFLGDRPIHVMDTPGHTSGHVVFHLPDDRLLFCGDTLFSLGCGRLFEGTAQQMWDSLSGLRRLPGDTMAYPAHEYTQSNGRFARMVDPDNPDLRQRLDQVDQLTAAGQPTIPVSLDMECRTNPFLRADQPPLAAAMSLPFDAQPVSVFAQLRLRKDVF